ncbi:MAG: IS66 family transposase [Candidatus Brocadiaceae bacterium]|nr:IS66 family transposase [Candidatus Brocadiaceae bacterium]
MLLNEHELRQMDDRYLKSLGHEELLQITLLLLNDVKQLREHLKQNPDNSSRPPSTREPWFETTSEDQEEEGETTNTEELDSSSIEEKPETSEDKQPPASNQRRKPGKQEGSPGHGRKQKLPVTNEVIHRATECAACGDQLKEDSEFIARTGHYVIDIKIGNENKPGIQVTNTKHIYGDTICSCGQVNHTKPNRCDKETDWDVELTEWHLVGPLLMSLICFFALRMRMSRPRIKEFLQEWLGIELSTGTINQCIHESGRAVAPLKEQLIEELINSGLLNVDETSWKEKGNLLWLWVFVTTTVVIYIIGSRSKETIEMVLGGKFEGYLMSDGYHAYRQYLKRLRCWAHLIRKAQGLTESLDKEAQIFGEMALNVLKTLMEAIYRARDGTVGCLVETYSEFLEEFKSSCEKHKNCKHEKTGALAREFLNDWDAIFRVLSNPYLPLTNNEAEQALRHWVILRKLCYGTRTPQGSRVFALLASVIDTCRKRKVSPWLFLSKVISERRQGNLCPSIPAAL